MRRFIQGLAKKVLIANQVGELWHIIETGSYAQMSTALSWLGIIAFALQIYFDFAGYSDMAIGLAQIFGMEFDENFNYPYISKSITEFWRRWHITLGSWFRDYIYIPLRRKQKRTCKANKKHIHSMVSNRSLAWSIMELHTMGLILWRHLSIRKAILTKSIRKGRRIFATLLCNILSTNIMGNIRIRRPKTNRYVLKCNVLSKPNTTNKQPSNILCKKLQCANNNRNHSINANTMELA